MTGFFRRCLWLGAILASPCVWAHSVSVIQGEAVVHPDRVEVHLRVSPEDILLSAGIPVLTAGTVSKADITAGIEARRQALLNGLVILDGSDKRLTGTLRKIEAPPVPESGMTQDQFLAASFQYQIDYPLSGLPPRLGFRQSFDEGAIPMPVSAELTILREGQTSGTTIPIPGGDVPETVTFDWKKSLPGAVTASNAAFEPADVFVYIVKEEVRLEILMPVRTMETCEAIERAKPGRLEIAEQEAARAPLERFFAERTEVRIDGVHVKPKPPHLDFFSMEATDLAVLPPPAPLDPATARVVVILHYPLKGAPRHLEINWSPFLNDRIPTIRVVVFAFDKGDRALFSREHPTLEWTAPSAPPAPSIKAVLAGAGGSGDSARTEVAEALLRNIYRAFDYPAESDIYDALAQSVRGELLATLYLKIKQSLIMQEQGGAISIITGVKVLDARRGEGKMVDGFTERVTWQVSGSVEHWGHIHTRVNECTADLGIAASAGEWRIVSMEVVKQSQVKSFAYSRKL